MKKRISLRFECRPALNLLWSPGRPYICDPSALVFRVAEVSFASSPDRVEDVIYKPRNIKSSVSCRALSGTRLHRGLLWIKTANYGQVWQKGKWLPCRLSAWNSCWGGRDGTLNSLLFLGTAVGQENKWLLCLKEGKQMSGSILLSITGVCFCSSLWCLYILPWNSSNISLLAETGKSRYLVSVYMNPFTGYSRYSRSQIRRCHHCCLKTLESVFLFPNMFPNKEFECSAQGEKWVTARAAFVLGIHCFIDKGHKYEICLNN